MEGTHHIYLKYFNIHYFYSDKIQHLEPCENVIFLQKQVEKLNEENIILKNQCQNVGNKLDNAILEVIEMGLLF